MFVIVLSAAISHGQQITGEIDGTVHDTSGAVIVGAEITVTNTDTHEIVRKLKSNSSGEFTASTLQVGTYEIDVEATGFQKAELTSIPLAVGDTLSRDVRLAPGTAVEVTVTADSEKPNLETNENAALIDSTEIKELALNTRNFEQMVLLQPGVSYGGADELNTGMVDPAGGRSSHALSINGLQPSQVMFLLDGADMLNHTSNGQVTIFPALDAIQQIQTTRNSYGAQYGGGGSAQVTTVTKAGAATYHGDVYFFWRSKYMNATPVFDLLTNPPQQKPDIRYNDYGATFGGPLFIPGIYPRSRSHTFFFFSEELRRLDNFVQTNTSDFPALPQTYGYFTTPVCLVFTTNPTTGKQVCSTAPNSRAVAAPNSPYPGYNYQIPANMMDPVAQAYMQDIFRPMLLLAPQPNPATPNQTIFQQKSTTAETQELARIDHQFNERLSGFFRFIYDPINQVIPNTIYRGSGFPGVTTTNVSTFGANYLGHLTWTATPNMVVETGYSFMPYHIEATPTGTSLKANSPDLADGAPNHVNTPYTDTTGRVPSLVMFGGMYGANGPLADKSYTSQAFENTTLALGRHVLYFGANFEHLTNRANAGTLNAGEYTFVSQQSKDPTTGLLSPVFDETFTSILTGQPATFTQSSLDPFGDIHENLYELYVQDNWRATSTLTLNFGMRYSIFQAPGEFSANVPLLNPGTGTTINYPDGRLGDFQPEGYVSAAAPTIGYDGSLCSTAFAGGAQCANLSINNAYNPLNGIVGGGASQSPYGHAISRTPFLNFAPRAGFAWNVYGDGKTSLRGGFGIYYEQQPLSTFQSAVDGNPAYVQTPVVTTFNPYTSTPVNSSVSNGLQNPGGTGSALNVISGIARDWKQPYVESWNLDIQQQIGKYDLLDVAYVGNNTIHLQGEEDLNQPPPNLYLSTNVTHGNYIVGKGLDLNAPCNAAMQCSLTSELNRIRPYLGWGPINYESTRYFADYNGLQVFLQHHQGKDLVMAVSYTFSKALANSGGPAIVNSGQVQYDPQNRLDLQSEWGPTVLDRRQIFSVHGVYNLPAHTSWHGFVGGAANGWEISTIIQLTSGVWLTPTVQGNDPAGLGGGAVGSNAQLRPQQLGDPNHGPQTQAQWFNIDEYNAQPPQGTIGDARVGSVLGPGYENVTLDVFKTFELPHAARLQIRCETFNAFNHVNWKNVSMTDNPGPGFGQVTTAYDNRTMQLGAKILF